jgi:hypothetical protein
MTYPPGPSGLEYFVNPLRDAFIHKKTPNSLVVRPWRADLE